MRRSPSGIAMLIILCAATARAGGVRALSSRFLFAQANASAPAPIITVGEDKVPNQYLVVFQDDVSPDQVADLASTTAAIQGITVQKVWSHALKGMFVNMTETQAAAVSLDPFVKYVEENARWHLSSSQQTYIDPRSCDPTVGTCPTVVDDRLWHIDRLDQNYASPTGSYAYCSDGTGVTVYEVDAGVDKFHNEFGPSGARIQPGFNSSGDSMPANDPCMGFMLPPVPPFDGIENFNYQNQYVTSSHGTSVASALGGNRVGVAKNVTIVPIKTIRCDQYAARYRLSGHFYTQNQTMFEVDSGGNFVAAVYRALNSGTTASTDPYGQGNWPTADNTQVQDGGVTWLVVPRADWSDSNVQTTQMIIDGLDWILSPSNPGPKSYAIVTMSTYRRATAITGSSGRTIEDSIRSLLSNNITVIASANNQNGNACDTSPARMSINNPDPSVANNVITAGGAMILNRPWTVNISDAGNNAHEADGANSNGAGSKGTEPPYDETKAVRDARWICGSGDSDPCSNTTPTQTSDPASGLYTGFTGGSNAGPCVTLFAPAKNLFVANLTSTSGYRDARLRAALASGTSWSAPITAGLAARILQNNPTYTPVQMRSALLSNCVSTLDAATLDTYDLNGNEITGTPNKLLKLGDVNIVAQPVSQVAADGGSTPLSVQGGTSTLQYQWYQVNADFDYVTYKNGAFTSAPIAGATSATFNAPSSSNKLAYWARVTDSCGSADSDIAVVVPKPAPPSNMSANANGAVVTIQWSSGSGAEQYEVQRRIAGQSWTVAGHVTGTSFSETPSAPAGIVIYRVLSQAGLAWLPPNGLATSAPSNNDFVNFNSATYEQLVAGTTTIKAQHLIELRQATNALCDAAGIPAEYQSADLQLSSLQGQIVHASDFTSLMSHINNARGALGIAAYSFMLQPAVNQLVYVQALIDLRAAIK